MSQRNPLTRVLRYAIQNVALDIIDQEPKEWPCTVLSVAQPFVTVQFNVTGILPQPVTMPIAMSQYVQLPIQAGDKGAALSATASLAGISGLSSSAATKVRQGNLSNLVFVPISGTSFPPINPNIVTVAGPNGVTIKNLSDGATTQIELGIGVISLTAGGHTVVLSAAGLVIDGIPFGTHIHPGVSTGTGVTGIPEA